MSITTKANTFTAEETAELYTTAEKAVNIALRARHEKSGLYFLHQLQNAQKNDTRCRNAVDLAEQIDITEQELATLREELAELRKNEQYLNRQAESLKNSEELRREYAIMIHTIRAQAEPKKDHIKRLTSRIADLYDRLNNTYSDRADLVQTAALKLIELETNPAPLTASLLADYGADTEEDLTEEDRAEAQARANFKAVINTVGKAISTIATPDALNSHTTKPQKATEEQVQEWLSIHKGYGEEHKEYVSRKRCRMSDCYRTLELKDTKKMQGFYIVTHYKTTAPYQYIEDYSETDENGENDIAYIKTYNPIVSDYQDLADLEDIISELDLTELDRLILEHYARALRYTGIKEDIIKHISNTAKVSTRTVYRRLDKIKLALTPRAEELHIISKSRKGA